MITAFKKYLSTLKLSPVSRKLYFSDVQKFLRWSTIPSAVEGPTLETLSSPTSYTNYLDSLRSQAVAPSMLKRTTASLRQFGTFLALTYSLPNPMSQLNLSTKYSVLPTDQYIKHFTNYLTSDHLSPLTIKSYKSDITRYLDWSHTHLSSTKMTEVLSEKNIKIYLNHLLDSGTALPSTIDRKDKSLARFRDWYANVYSVDHVTDNKISSPTPWLRSTQHSRSEGFPHSGSVSPDVAEIPVKKFNYRMAFTFAVLMLFAATLGIFGYRQFSRDATLIAAYPSTPVTPNRQLSFQGRLENAAGTPITTATNLTFKLFTASSGGTELYSSGACSLTPDADGVFNTQIGDTCGSAIAATVFTENQDVWLEVTVAAETLTPRQQIATVAYALNSETLQGFPLSSTVSAIRNTVVPMNQWGEILVGEQSPRLTGISGTFAISAPALTFTTTSGSNGNISIAPDGTGQVNVTGNTTSTNFFNVSNAQLTTGSLITGTAANANTGFKLIDLLSGASPTSKFSVTDAGLTTVGADLYVSSGISLYNTAVSDGTIEATQFCTGDGETNCVTDFSTFATGTNYWTRASGNISPLTLNDTISATTSAAVALTLTQTGAFDAFLVQDAAGDTTPFVIDQSGNVGIGTTAPRSKLDVKATDQTNAGLLSLTASGSTNFWDFAFDSATTPNLWLQYNGGATPAMFWKNDGSIGISDTSPDALLDLDSTATTGNIFGILSTTLTTGEIADITATYAPTDGSTNEALDINLTHSPTTLADNFSGINLTTTDGTALGNTVYGLNNTITLTGNAAKTGIGLYSSLSSSSTTADILSALDTDTTVTGIMTTGTRSIYGLRSQPTAGAESTGGTTNVYGGYFKPSADVGVGGTVNGYGLYVANGTYDTDGTSTNTGLYVESPTGADTNYAAIFAGGNVGVGTTGPASKLSVGGVGDSGSTIYGTNGTSYGALGNSNSGVYGSGTTYGVQATATTYGVYGDGGTTGVYGVSSAGQGGYFTSTSGYALITGTGNVGIGTTGPDAKLDSLSTTEQLRLTYTDGTVYSAHTVDSSGNLTIDNTGTKTIVADDLQITGGDILDSNGNESIRFGTTASAVNEATLTNAATAGTVLFAATGGDTDVALSIDSKGADALNLNGTATGDINLAGGSGSTGCTITNSTGDLSCAGSLGTTNISFASAAGTITLKDNTASAFKIVEGANTYVDITTTNDAETFTLNLPTGGATSHTVNLFTANIAQTINIGTGTAADTINIGTGGTTADDINLGGLATSHVDVTGVMNFAGGTTYYVDASGNAKFLDLQVSDTGNPGITVGDSTNGQIKIGDSTITDNNVTLTLDSSTGIVNIPDDTSIQTSSSGLSLYKNISPDATPSWSTGTAGGTARFVHASILYNGKIYSWGGANGSTLNTLDIYDINSNSWSTGATGGTARYRHSAVTYNGKIYFWGGYTGAAYLNTVDIYDIAGNSWSTGTAGGTARANHTSTLYNGKIYSWGGTNGSTLNTVDIYDIAGNSWSTGTAGGTARQNHTAVLYNNKVYFWAGTSGSNTIDIYDIAGNSWSTGTAGGTARANHTSALYNGKIYSWGGNNGSDLNTVDIYDIAGNSWSTGTAGGTARANHTSALYNGKIYSWGGGTYLDTVDIYDIGDRQALQTFYENGESMLSFKANAVINLDYGKLSLMNGNVGIGTTAPGRLLTVSNATPTIGLNVTGLTLSANQKTAFGAVDNEAGRTSYVNGTYGGLVVVGNNTNTAANAVGLWLAGYVENNPTTYGAIYLNGAKHDGAGALTAIGDSNILLNIANNSSAKVTVLGSGFVGIGTTAPTTNLNIKSTGTTTTLGQLDTNLRLQTNTTTANAGNEISFYGLAGGSATSDLLTYAAISAPVSSNNANIGTAGYLSFSTKATAATSGLTERMRVTEAGNVGIGTLTPGATLHIASSGSEKLRLEDSSATGNPYLSFYQTTTRRSYIQHVDSGDNLRLNSEYGGIELYAGGALATTIDAEGDVGIGVAPGAQRLRVDNNVASTVALIFNDGDLATHDVLRLQGGTDAGGGGFSLLSLYDGDGTLQASVTMTGGAVTYGAFTANHDVMIPDDFNSTGYPYGTLMCVDSILPIDPDSDRAIKYKSSPCSISYSPKVLGAYAQKYDDQPNLHQVYILGDGHVLVNGQNGDLEVGDMITTSSTEGIGMKAVDYGTTMGRVQQPHHFDSPTEVALIPVQYGLETHTPPLTQKFISDLLKDNTLTVQSITTNLISPLAPGQDIAITGPVQISPNLANQANTEPLLVVDGELDAATISARTAKLQDIYAENITAKNIVADTISANHIEGLDAKLATLSATLTDEEVTSITDRIKARLQTLTDSGPTAADIPVPAEASASASVTVSPWHSDTASVSATLSSLDIDFVTINDYLAVIGSATITDLDITGRLYTASIESKTGLLNLGSNTLLVDASGVVTVNGDLNVTGRITASELNLERLNVLNETGDVVATIDASGSANLASLTTNMITIASSSEASNSATPSGLLTSMTSSNATAGESRLISPDTELTIESPYITPNSLVYLTPTTNTDNKVLFVKSKNENSFTVAIDAPASTDISFNWWIIQLK